MTSLKRNKYTVNTNLDIAVVNQSTATILRKLYDDAQWGNNGCFLLIIQRIWHYRLLYFDIKMHSQNFSGKFLYWVFNYHP